MSAIDIRSSFSEANIAEKNVKCYMKFKVGIDYFMVERYVRLLTV